MKLKRFRVTNFKSVHDSGWISCDEITTLVGVNESGKSNLLLALWKLNPARGGEIDSLHDLPVKNSLSYEKNRNVHALSKQCLNLEKALLSLIVS